MRLEGLGLAGQRDIPKLMVLVSQFREPQCPLIQVDTLYYGLLKNPLKNKQILPYKGNIGFLGLCSLGKVIQGPSPLGVADPPPTEPSLTWV